MTAAIDHSQLLGRLGGWRMQADRVATECRGPEEVTLAEWAALRGDLDAAIAALETPAPACSCYRCLTESGETQGGFPVTALRMVVCGACGNKRCPHATDHRFACTASNDLDQPGSRYCEGWSTPRDWRHPGGLQKMQATPDGPSLLAGELERLSAIWMVMSEQQTPGVCADIALFAMQNRAAIISALRVADEARLAGWIISDAGAIFRPAHGPDLMAALEDADKIVGEQRQRIEELEREGAHVVEAVGRYVTVGAEAVAQAESDRANWPPYNSAHEGFAVIHEEFDELKDHVWTNQKRRDIPAMRAEAIQLAACAIAFAADICTDERGRR